MKPQRIADSLPAEITRLREAGLLPEHSAPAPAARPLRVTGGMGDPDCPICHGLGYVRNDVPVGGSDTHAARDFGKLEPCPCARARLQAAQTARLRAETGMDDADLALGWGQLYHTQATAEAITAVRQTLTRAWGWVYLHGEPGPGKTVLLKTAIAETARTGAG